MGRTGALEFHLKLASDYPAVIDFQNYLASSHLAIGQFQARSGKPAEALESYRRALVIFEKLASDNPAVTDFQNRLAKSYSEIGKLQLQSGKLAEVLESQRRALLIRQKLATDNPAVIAFQNRLAATHSGIGTLFLAMGKTAAALAEQQMARAIYAKLDASDPALGETLKNPTEGDNKVAETTFTTRRAPWAPTSSNANRDSARQSTCSEWTISAIHGTNTCPRHRMSSRLNTTARRFGSLFLVTVQTVTFM